jgi:hypothetical protein
MNELIQFNEAPGVFRRRSAGNGTGVETRYIKPPKCRGIPDRMLKYEYAQDLAKDIKVTKGSRHFIIISGNFIAGDFIEALIVKNNWHVKTLTISTLSMHQGNVDSLVNLIEGNFVDAISLIVSDYFFAHERGGLVRYIYQNLDKDRRFQFAAAGTHCKIANIETHCGLKIVIHGSANLRSSGNIEQMQIEENAQLYDFNQDIFDSILTKYKTINHSIRRNDLWPAVQK